jgi:SAM-dependent methyltransferase
MRSTDEGNRRRCAVCDGDGRSVHYQQRFALIGDVSVCSGYEVVTCDQCCFAYAFGGPTQRQLDAYYERASKYENPLTRGVPSADDLLRFAPMAERIAEAVADRKARVVEVGCSTGGLLHILARDYGFTNVNGIDPSPACRLAARELYGIDVVAGSLRDLRSLGTCDVIVLQQVLEHVVDFDAAFDALLSTLTPSGIVCVEVPDVAAFADAAEPPFQQFSVEHMNFFSPESLAALFTRHGFASAAGTASTTDGCIFGVFRRGTAAAVPDRTTVPALRKYVAASQNAERLLRAKLRDLLRGHQRVLVWGAGTLSLHLLETGAFDDASIAAFVDSNPRYHGKSIHGVPVIPPACIQLYDVPILIATRDHSAAIEAQIRTLRLANPVWPLYPAATS